MKLKKKREDLFGNWIIIYKNVKMYLNILKQSINVMAITGKLLWYK
jgi:hypothetical protein